ncbi:MAG: TadE family protein [Planctomycetota bacterium]
MLRLFSLAKSRPKNTGETARRRRRGSRSRKATATVEMAVLVPVLLTFTLGTLDLCSLQFLRESAVLAAYEGSRQGVARNRTNEDVVDRVRQFLDERNISYDANTLCDFGNRSFTNGQTLEPITLAVNIPAAPNLLVPSSLVGDLTITANVTMVKEWANQD